MYYYSGCFADIDLVFKFHDSGTAKFYGKSISTIPSCKNAIVVPNADIKQWQKQWNTADDAYAEYVISCNYACDALMRYDRVVFHGAAFLWHEKAWILSAPSGTGKTTQLKNWVTLFAGEVEILNGDKPILEISADGIMVHPSPWKGKEELGRDDIIAPLGGIVFLRQDNYNCIENMNQTDAVRFLFGRIYSSFSTEKEVLNAARILETILSNIPVWILRNLGDLASTRLTYQTLIEEGY